MSVESKLGEEDENRDADDEMEEEVGGSDGEVVVVDVKDGDKDKRCYYCY